MPYRRLPKTDVARVKALRKALRKGDQAGYNSPVLSQKTQHEARGVLSRYEQSLNEYNQMIKRNQNLVQDLHQVSQKARLYVSHFIQVLNMCVQRGEILREKKLLYGLEPDSDVVPSLASDKMLLEWGKKIIEGENKRTQMGGAPIYTPNIAKVIVFYEKFKTIQQEVDLQRGHVMRYRSEVEKFREASDEILLDIWNQVEGYYAEMPLDERLQACQEYGLVYYYRRGEPRP